MYKLMLGDSSVALKTETVCTVPVGVICTGTVSSCFLRAPWAAVLYGHCGQLFFTGTVGRCFVRAPWAAVLYGHSGQLFCSAPRAAVLFGQRG